MASALDSGSAAQVRALAVLCLGVTLYSRSASKSPPRGVNGYRQENRHNAKGSTRSRVMGHASSRFMLHFFFSE